MENILVRIRNAHGPWLFISLCLAGLLLSFLISSIGAWIAYVVVLLIVAASVVMLSIANFRLGFLVMTVYSFFLFHLGRILPGELPMGTLIEFFLLTIFFGIVSKNFQSGENGWLVFRNPVGYAILVYGIYALLQLANPYSTSLAARGIAIRETLAALIMFYAAMHVFTTYKHVISFTKLWVVLALLVALYGIYQEHVGLQDWELEWVYSSPERYQLTYIWGNMRKWSFLSDISAFGLYMAYAGIFCGVMALGPWRMRYRVMLGISSLLMLISMSYSGTRTATAMVLIGFGFYFLMTMNNKKSLVFAILFAIGFAGMIYGPFYGPTMNRIRSTFRVSEDASMNVRDVKRKRLQPYIWSHPIGGGINTAGNTGRRYEPGHALAGKYDPDSGYLRIALERGWIGLLLFIGMNATILIVGLKNYYKAQQLSIKTIYAAYMAGFFALTVAHYTQDALWQKPVVVMLTASYAFMVRLIDFDKPLSKKDASLKT